MRSVTIDLVTVDERAAAVPARLDIAGRAAPVPLLAVSTLLAALSGLHQERSAVGYLVVGVAAAWSILVSWWTTPPRAVGRPAFAWLWSVHFALAAFLVWVNPWFGIFAFSSYLLVEVLPEPVVKPACLANAFVLAASQTAGYPFGRDALGWVTYVVVAVFNGVLVLAMFDVTTRVQRQNTERGRMIDELNETNEALSAALAENAGLHDQLVEHAREAGVLDERQRLAGEIHDTLAQGLIGIVAHLEAANEADGLPERLRHHLEQARTTARENLAEARRSVGALRPEQLEHTELADALRVLATGWSARSGTPVHTQTTGPAQPIAPDAEDALFRVAQEALTNVEKHADASRVGVTLTFLDDVALLDVRDDGVGWAGTPRPGGYGLSGMRERLARVGGTLSVETAPGEGTALNACVPVGGIA